MATRARKGSTGSSKPPGKAEDTGSRVAVSRPREAHHPLLTLRQEIDRLFDDLWSDFPLFPNLRLGFDMEPFGRFRTALGAVTPAVDLVEKGKEYRVSIELPGMDKNDIDVTVTDDSITIKGEKKDEREEKEEDYFLSERRYGSFTRSFRLPVGTDPGKIDASFEKGVLMIKVPKTGEAIKKQRKVAIKGK
ncbi:MAG: Hsp20/alpha crystallin family protein [Alphaproteobacteria bacterium]